MKKTLAVFSIHLVILTVSVFGQAVNRSQYRAIDPFDYRLEEEKAARNSVRKFKSVVTFVSHNDTDYLFSSLDKGTFLQVSAGSRFTPPSAGQVVTIYFTATKGVLDTLALDEIDTENTTEAGIRLRKSTVPSSSRIRKSDYKEIDPFGFTMEEPYAEQDVVRKYKSTVLFSSQDGINFHFISLEEGEESDYAELHLRVTRRFPPLTQNQRVTIYYTATMGITDVVILDDIEL